MPTPDEIAQEIRETLPRQVVAGLLSTLEFRPSRAHPEACLPMADQLIALLSDQTLRAQIAQLATALRGLALSGTSDPPRLVGFCDDGYLCQHPECERARDALEVAEGD